MSRPSISRRRKITFALITTALFLAVTNGAVVLYEKLQYGGTQAEKEGIYIQREDGRRVLRPGAVLEGARTKVRINSLGFRGPELLSPKPENGFRVWCVGGSTTFDVFAPDDDHTWPAQLQSRLQNARPDRTIEVINAGIPGEVISGSQEDFISHFQTVQPDVLLIYHGPNDLRDIRFGGPAPPTGDLEQQFALLRATRSAVNRKLPQLPEEWKTARLSSHELTEVGGRIERLISVALERGVRVMLASHALKIAPGATGDAALRDLGEVCVLMHMYPDAVIHVFSDFNNMMAAMAERMKLPFSDVRGAVPADDHNWGDALHFSLRGSALAAEALSKSLLETGWL